MGKDNYPKAALSQKALEKIWGSREDNAWESYFKINNPQENCMFSEERQFEFPNERAAQFASRALAPELKSRFSVRSQASINTNKNLVLLKVVAKERQAMNASLGSFSRLLGMCGKIAFLEE